MGRLTFRSFVTSNSASAYFPDLCTFKDVWASAVPSLCHTPGARLPLMLSPHARFPLLHPHMLFVGVSHFSLSSFLLITHFFFCLCCYFPCLLTSMACVFYVCFSVFRSVYAGCPPVARIPATAACQSSEGVRARWRRRTTRATPMTGSTRKTTIHSPPTCIAFAHQTRWLSPFSKPTLMASSFNAHQAGVS